MPKDARLRSPKRLGRRGGDQIGVDGGEALEPASQEDGGDRADEYPGSVAEAAVGAALASKQAGTKDVEAVEPDRLQRPLHLPLRPKVEIPRPGVRSNRRDRHHSPGPGPPGRGREGDDRVEIHGSEFRFRSRGAHRRPERGYGAVRRKAFDPLRPIRRRRHIFDPALVTSPARPARQGVDDGAAGRPEQEVRDEPADQPGGSDQDQPGAGRLQETGSDATRRR